MRHAVQFQRHAVMAVVTERCEPETSVCFIMSHDPAAIDKNGDIAGPIEPVLPKSREIGGHHVQQLSP